MCGVTFSLPTPPSGGQAEISIGVIDVAGNQSFLEDSYPYDDIPPTVSIWPEGDLVASNQYWNIQLFLEVHDEHSGPGTLEFLEGPGAWQISGGENSVFAVSGSLPAEPGINPFPLKFTVTDLAGNSTIVTVPVWVDTAAPALNLEASQFVDESTVTPEFDPESGVLNWNQTLSMSIVFSDQTCVPVCPPFAKFASRLGYDDESSVLENNLPGFALAVSDLCPGDPYPETGVYVEYAFFYEQIPLHQGTLGTIPCSGGTVFLPIATPFFAGVGVEDATFGLIDLPTRVEIMATDESGQSDILEIGLNMFVMDPPVFLYPEDDGSLPPDAVSQLMVGGGPELEFLSDSPGILQRFVLYNPGAAPVVIGPLAWGSEFTAFLGGGNYGPAESVATPGCPMGQCKYKTGDEPYSTCQLPIAYAPETYFGSEDLETAFRLTTVEDGQETVLQSGVKVTLPPAGSCYLDILTSYHENGLLLNAPTFIESAPGEQTLVYLLDSQPSAALCSWTPSPFSATSYEIREILVAYHSEPGEQPAVIGARANGADSSTPYGLDLDWDYTYNPNMEVHYTTW